MNRTAAVVLILAASGFASAFAYAQSYPPPAPGPAYVGSNACEKCHAVEFAAWKSTLHVQMTKPIADARVEGDFSPGTHVEQNGRSYTMQSKDGRYAISIAKGDGPAEKFQVDYTLGARRFQGYLSKLPDGRIYVLPIFWHNETKRWLDWKEIAPVPDHPAEDLRQIWNITCVNCHATNLAQNYDPPTRTYRSTWTEMGVGCEACHGPGAAHVAAAAEWEKNPAAAGGRTAEELRIFSPQKATARQNFDTCGYCHGNKNNLFFGFTPGDRYEDFALPFLISQPIPANDPQGDFWPDGRPSRFNRPQALTESGCFQRGNLTCTTCHRVHGPDNAHMLKVAVEESDGRRTRASDGLCTQCHARPDDPGGTSQPTDSDDGRARVTAVPVGSADAPVDWSAHTHHAADSQGSRCIECHMSDVNWRLFTRRRDHTFQPPVPELTAKYGVPNACTTCHEDKSPEWAAGTIDRWYGNGVRRRAIVAMADTIYRAGAGDRSALPDVARLAADRSRGFVIRASAADFAGQLLAKSAGTARPETINALIGAADDPEAVVRAAAVRALGLAVDERATAVIAARLGDGSRIVRARAAEALLGLGIARLDGAVGAALARAQDEWAESLRSFQDVAHDQASLGRLELARGRTAEAADALNAAVALDPSDAQPHVYLGVIAARAGRFDEAVKQFTAARALQPGYPNLDRLIEEARKRR